MNPTPTAEAKAPKKPAAKKPATPKRSTVPAIAVTGSRTANPTKLEVGENVRKNPQLDQAFLDSITERGILAPIIVEAGLQLDSYKVIDGQRRVMAALQLGLTEVPIHVIDTHDDQTRIVDQLIANDQRDQITTADRAKGYQQLELFGLTADQIAKKTARPKAEVAAALTVAGSATALAVVEAHQVDLEQAAVIADFADDAEAVDELTTAALEDPASFKHAVAALEAERTLKAATASMVDDLNATGIEVLDDTDPAVHVPIEKWRSAEGKQLDADDAVGQGLVATISASQGNYDYDIRVWIYTPRPRYFILMEEGLANGFTLAAGTAAAAPSEEVSEEKKAERRRVIANNKAWPIATKVRHEWITTELLTRKSLPSDVNVFIAIGVAGGHLKDSYSSGVIKAMDWLQIKSTTNSYGYQELVHEVEAKPGTANRIALAILLAEVEGKIADREAWRFPGIGSHTGLPKMARYLNQLASWGYGLSEIEAQLISDAKAAAK